MSVFLWFCDIVKMKVLQWIQMDVYCASYSFLVYKVVDLDVP